MHVLILKMIVVSEIGFNVNIILALNNKYYSINNDFRSALFNCVTIYFKISP